MLGSSDARSDRTADSISSETSKFKRNSAFGIIYALGLIFFVLATGTVLVIWLGATSFTSRTIYGLVDIPAFAVVFFCGLFLAITSLLSGVAERTTNISLTGLSVPVISGMAFGATVIGTHVVYLGYAFSLDELMTRLQAEIFHQGQLAVTVSEEWRVYGRAIYPAFFSYDVQSGLLSSGYRPGMSALYALFDLVGLGLYTSAFMNAAAIVLVARVARQIFPDTPEAPVVAALLLATSQQALFTAMTSYAMSAHLCLNLLWITLFLDDRFVRHVTAAFVGVVTASLHQIHMHLFFALPFLLTLMRPFQPRLVLLYSSVYIIGHLAIASWDWISFNRWIDTNFANAGTVSTQAPTIFERVRYLAELPKPEDIFTVIANLVRLMSWQSLALLPLLMLAVGRLRQHRFIILMLCSFVLSTLPYVFLMPDQGHGWGYRYMHGFLGFLSLMAIPGWTVLRERSTSPRLASWVLGCLLISPLLLLPLRAVQINKMVSPFVAASELVSAQDASVVIVDNFEVWVGWDIPRNSPISLTEPIGMNENYLSVEQIKHLCRDHAAIFLGADVFQSLGMIIINEVPNDLRERHAERRLALKDCKGGPGGSS